MCWHTFVCSAPSPTDSACHSWDCPGQHHMGPGAQCVPGSLAPGFTAPKLPWEGVCGAQHGQLLPLALAGKRRQ